MSMFDGVSQCWVLSRTCVVNWNAWAALGAWVASGATFLAVLLPYRNALRREHFRAELEFLEFVPVLGEFERKIQEADEIIQGFVELDRWPGRSELRYLVLTVDLPVVEPVPALARILVPLKDLRVELKRWNEILLQMERENLQVHGEYKLRFLNGMSEKVAEMKGIAAVLRKQIAITYPQLESRLQ